MAMSSESDHMDVDLDNGYSEDEFNNDNGNLSPIDNSIVDLNDYVSDDSSDKNEGSRVKGPRSPIEDNFNNDNDNLSPIDNSIVDLNDYVSEDGSDKYEGSRAKGPRSPSEDNFNNDKDNLSPIDNSIVDLDDYVSEDSSDKKEGDDSSDKKGGKRVKGPWSPREDKWLVAFVRKNGDSSWKSIAGVLNRTPKSCRLRWFNQLNPKISFAPFTEDEDKIVVGMVKDGSRWSDIARVLGCRTDNQVKNRWNSKLRKKHGDLRKQNRNKRSTQTAGKKLKGIPSSISDPISSPLPTSARIAGQKLKGRPSSISDPISSSLPTSARIAGKKLKGRPSSISDPISSSLPTSARIAGKKLKGRPSSISDPISSPLRTSARTARQKLKGRPSSISDPISSPLPTLARTVGQKLKGRPSSIYGLSSSPLPTSASASPRPRSPSPPRLVDGSVNPCVPPGFVVSYPSVNPAYPPASLYPAPIFNRFTSLSLCPPGLETDDVLYPRQNPNSLALYPSTSQQHAPAPVENFTALMQDAIASEDDEPNRA